MIGEELRDLRKRAGFKAAELAEILGYRGQQWSRFETGKSPIPPSVEYAARWVCENEIVNHNRSLSAAERAVQVLIPYLTAPVAINQDTIDGPVAQQDRAADF